ncbi:MAG TPA: hypothetical protein VFK06_19710 [Candidatus Angelobacter sp.]|nr:hypothetical protein [Candidatus Angelobacter sp.]
MALRPCKECKQQISSDAKICPHCGKKVGISAGAACLVIIILLFLIGYSAHRLGQPIDGGVVSTPSPPSQKSVAPKNTKALAAALKNVTIRKDRAEQLEFYSPKPQPAGIYAYIGRTTTDSTKYMRIKVRAYASNIFLASDLTFLIDGSTQTISVNPFKEAGMDPNPEGDGAVFADVSVEDQLLRNIIAAKEVYVSLKSEATGKRTSFRMTKVQQSSLRQMLSVYDLM